jgi:hypothetical protein
MPHEVAMDMLVEPSGAIAETFELLIDVVLIVFTKYVRYVQVLS